MACSLELLPDPEVSESALWKSKQANLCLCSRMRPGVMTRDAAKHRVYWGPRCVCLWVQPGCCSLLVHDCQGPSMRVELFFQAGTCRVNTAVSYAQQNTASYYPQHQAL